MIKSRFYRVSKLGLNALPKCPFNRIVIINLAHRRDRLSAVLEQLHAVRGLNQSLITIFPAVNGHSVCAERLVRTGILTLEGQRRLMLPESKKIWGMDLTQGAIGCALSHLTVWAAAAREPVGTTTLVVEDDSLFLPNFLEDLEVYWDHVPSDWELVYLSGLDTAGCAHLLPVTTKKGLKNPYFSYVHQLHRTTNCYVLHQRGAQALIDLVPPLTFQLDTELNMRVGLHKLTGVPFVVAPRCYAANPPLVVQGTRWGSEIQTPFFERNEALEEIERKRRAGWI